MSGALLAVVLAAAAPSAGGDREIGSLLKPALKPQPNAKSNGTRRALYRIVECAVERRPSTLRRVLDIGNDEAYDAAYNVISKIRGCKTGNYIDDYVDEMSFSSDRSSFRGMISEALVKKEDKLDGESPLSAEKSYPREWYSMTGRPLPIDEMATCVAATSPASVAALLRTEPETPQEMSALQAAGPAMGTCLQVGYKLNANPLSLRTALAEAFYHRAFDPASAPRETEKAS